MTDLMACPFCGDKARVQQNGYKPDRTPTWWEIACGKCDFVGPAFDMKEEAIAAWNTRTTLPAITDAQIERVAFVLWKAEADRAAPNVGKNRTAERFADELPETREKWLYLAAAIRVALDPAP